MDDQRDQAPPPTRSRRVRTLKIAPADAAGLRLRPMSRDRCTLTVLAGPSPGAVFEVTAAPTVLGRDAECAVQLDDAGLSGVHAEIERRDGAYWITDLTSTNGTFVNGQRIHEPRRLTDGDRVQMGAETLLKVSLHDAVEQAAARKLYESAVRDPLTGAYNRRYIMDRLPAEVASADRHGLPLTVLIFDLDHFKSLNDNHGHPAGDAALEGVVKALRPVLRQEDELARYGGEEFLLLARVTDREGAAVLAERLRHTVEEMIVEWNGQRLPVTISVGFATMTPTRRYPGPDALLAAADRALYEAKEGGRNCVRGA